MTLLRLAIYATGLLCASVVCATSNYDYAPNEYVTIATGLSPNGRFAVTAHGEGEGGIDNFHLYLTDTAKNWNISMLADIIDTLDTGANALAAKWSRDSRQVTIIYRIDRHVPLKATTYRITDQGATCIKPPFDVISDELLTYWQKAKPSKKKFHIVAPVTQTPNQAMQRTSGSCGLGFEVTSTLSARPFAVSPAVADLVSR